MLPFNTSVIIPFTQQTFDETFHYRSEPGKPMLLPLLSFRTSPEMVIPDEDLYESIYHELLNRLPKEISKWLSDEMHLPFHDRDPDAAAMHLVLTIAADAIGWLAMAIRPVRANSPAAAYRAINIALPYAALAASLEQSGFVIQHALNIIYNAGPNNPQYDHFISTLSGLQDAIIKALDLQREIEKGLINEDVKKQAVESANLLHEAAERIKTAKTSNDLSIISAQMEALATSLTALSNTNGTPALILGSAIALFGLNDHTSGLRPFGPGFETIMDAVINGVLSSFTFGPRTEIEELAALQQDLTILKTSQ